MICNLERDVPDGVVGDPARIRQVLLNLLGNAMKFTDEGHVALRVHRSDGPGPRICFTVSDTGIGIPPDKIDQVFEPFTQAEQSTSRRFGGTGLGLAIARRMAIAMQGELEVTSELGVGTTFHLTLPLGAQSEGAASHRTGVASPSVAARPLAHTLIESDCVAEYVEMRARAIVSDVMRHRTVDGLRRALELAEPGREATIVVCDPLDESERARLDTTMREQKRHNWVLLQSTGRARSWAAGPDTSFHLLFAPVIGPEFDELLTGGRGADGGAHSTNQPVKRGALATERPMKILLVEDNPVNQRVAERLLTKWGHETTVADNGQIALDVLERDSFEVVLMDVHMPVMDGLEATRHQRARERCLGLEPHRIIAMTANAAPADRARCLEAGMDAHVAKPFDAQALFETLERIAESSDIKRAG